MLWEEEGTVSVHPSKELTTVSGENCQIKFGRTYYTGKIACSGKVFILVLLIDNMISLKIVIARPEG